MIDKEQVLKALRHLEDPTYRKSVVELNLIRDVLVKQSNVSLTFVMTVDDEAKENRFREKVKEALEAIGAENIHIRFRKIADHEKAEIEGKWPGRQAAHTSSPAERAQGPALLSADSGITFIAIASGKGGVGKSSVTVNLAAALARKGKKVGIIDADIYGFSVPDMMGIEERPKLENNRILPVERFGVKVISTGFFVQDNAPVIWRGPMLSKMLRNFFSEVNWGELDYMLLDLPPGTGDVALDVHHMIPHSKEIIVTTPHATAAFVAARAGAMALQTKHEILALVENMSYYECESCGRKDYIFGRGGGAKLAEELHTELLAQIPLGAPDNHISEPDFSPSVYKSDSPTGRLYNELADKVIAKTS